MDAHIKASYRYECMHRNLQYLQQRISSIEKRYAAEPWSDDQKILDNLRYQVSTQSKAMEKHRQNWWDHDSDL